MPSQLGLFEIMAIAASTALEAAEMLPGKIKRKDYMAIKKLSNQIYRSCKRKVDAAMRKSILERVPPELENVDVSHESELLQQLKQMFEATKK